MVTLVKHEWHSVDSQFALELDENLLSEIYPDLGKRALKKMLKDIEGGMVDIEDIVHAAWENDVDLEWDRQYDDWWTDRKGGYEVTYELGDESSWVKPNEPDPPYYKCTKCRWEGGKYETLTQYHREDDTVIEDYFNTSEDSHHTSEVCPMCDSKVKLTEFGEKEEREAKERQALWDQEALEAESMVECYSCGEIVDVRTDLVTLDGQDTCPHCGEGWVDPESISVSEELNMAMEDLKSSFEKSLEQAEDKPKKRKKKQS